MWGDELKKLEAKIYAFSVDVFSFVKTLINQNISNQHTQGILSASNQLYSTFLDLIDNQADNTDNMKNKCLQLVEQCCDFIKNIEVEKKLLNEKVDLTIEANELSRLLKEKFSLHNTGI